VLSHIEGLYSQLSSNVPLNYKFSSEAYSRLYKSEQITGTLTMYLTLVAILISCMGLFGLATYTTGRRRKEIAVRKVVGASVGMIVVLLAKDFMKLVLIASLVAIPIALLAISRWMENFAYQIEITPALFFLSTSMALLIALVTVAFKTIKAAIANPILSLREK
jgi:putative ABC transport system permease protein